MQRRHFMKSALWGSAGIMAGWPVLKSHANTHLVSQSSSSLKIKKIRYYAAPGYTKPLFNQARGIVEIETDGGIIGIGEGGTKDSIEQCAQMIIGADPFRIEHIWQLLYRGMFYPPGREKLHAVGAIEMALHDIKGKALNIPVYELLGGATREYVESYATGYGPSKATAEEDRARDCIAAGFRSYRIGPTGGNGEKTLRFLSECKKYN